MRNFLTAAVALVIPVAALAGGEQTAILDVQNMTCAACGITIGKALDKLPGVQSKQVDAKAATVTVEWRSSGGMRRQ